MGTVLYIILAVLVVFIGIILLRTLAFRPHKEEAVTAEPVELNEEKIIADMADMIRCKTVSNRDHSLVDWGEFDRFQTLLLQVHFFYCTDCCEFFHSLFVQCEHSKLLCGKLGCAVILDNIDHIIESIFPILLDSILFFIIKLGNFFFNSC